MAMDHLVLAPVLDCMHITHGTPTTPLLPLAAARAKCSGDMARAVCNADAAMRAAVLCRYRHDQGRTGMARFTNAMRGCLAAVTLPDPAARRQTL